MSIENPLMAAVEFGERLKPDEAGDRGLVNIYYQRYEFAVPFTVGKRVLDAGCGFGYGSYLLAESALRVMGVDISEEAIGYARIRYARDNITYVVGDIEALPSEPGSLDVICCLEAIEHLDSPEKHLESVINSLSGEGIYLVSTPNAPRHDAHPENAHHKQEFEAEEFRALLKRYFRQVSLYGHNFKNRPVLASTLKKIDIFKLRKLIPFWWRYRLASTLLDKPQHELNLEDLEITREDVKYAHSVVAVCSNARRSLDL